MKNTKHTPGPWQVGNYVRVIRGKEVQVFTVYAMTNFAIVRHVYAPTKSGYKPEANARLIAAAPELLEMCEIAEGWLGELVNAGILLDRNGEGVLAGLRAAVAKAKGE